MSNISIKKSLIGEDDMDMKDAPVTDIETYSDGKMNLIVGICEKIMLPEIINKNLEKLDGRNPEIPYGILAEMMMVNLYDDHHPLYLLDEYFQHKDLEGIFHYPVKHEQINDDRFGVFLDALYDAGPRKVFGELSSKAFSVYGITVKNINFDTTSKVMWGIYESADGKEGEISIDFGHSKQKRSDKKQIKMALGVAEGVIVDAKILSGNKDDKTYNKENLEEIEDLLIRLDTSKGDFYYIADSALFTKENLKSADEKDINLITRMPDTINLVKKSIKEALANNKVLMKDYNIKNSKNDDVEYKIMEKQGVYNDVSIKYVVCYSKKLEKTKKKTIEKQIKNEKEDFEKLIKTYKKPFACSEDAEREIQKLNEKVIKKIKFHNVDMEVSVEEKRKPGRPSEKQAAEEKEYQYYVSSKIIEDEHKIKGHFEESCTFVLCSNDLNISGEDLLQEYKTQSSVEKKFQQLKSPHFVNSLYLDSVRRIEALTYLILITMMVLSVVENIVRKGLKEDNDKIIGPGKVKMPKPTLRAIVDIFYSVRIRVISTKERIYREFVHPLNDSQKKILKYLSISEDIFIWNNQ
jgi:transposase